MLLAFTPTDAAMTLAGGLLLFGLLVWLLGRWVKAQTAASVRELQAGESGVHPRPSAPRVSKCGTCKHFDLPAGRAAMEQWPAFVLATKYRTPAQMYNTAESPDNVPVTSKWTDFGACGKHAEVRYEGDKCEHYEALP